MLLTIKHMLEFEGWTVEAVRDGEQASACIESAERYDAIVLSENFRDANGVALLKRTRELAHRRRTPVILFASTGCEQQASCAGASAVLQKPNDIKKLTATVARCLQGRDVFADDEKGDAAASKRYVHKPGEHEWFARIEARAVYDRAGQLIAYTDHTGKVLRHPRTQQIIAREHGGQFYSVEGNLWGSVLGVSFGGLRALRAAR